MDDNLPRGKPPCHWLHPLPWIVVLLLTGACTTPASLPLDHEPPALSTPVTPPTIQEQMLLAADHSLASAREQADQRVSRWIDTLRGRLAPSFMDWYFSFPVMGRVIVSFCPEVDEHQELDSEAECDRWIEHEFTRQVIIPEEAEPLLRRIGEDAARNYLAELDGRLHQLPPLPTSRKPDLDAILATLPTADRQLSTTSNILGDFVLTKMKPLGIIEDRLTAFLVSRIESRLPGRLASLVNPAVTLYQLNEDFEELSDTIAESRSAMRGELLANLHILRKSILDDRTSGILSALYHVDSEVRRIIASPTWSR